MEADKCEFAGAEFKQTKLFFKRSPAYVPREKSCHFLSEDSVMTF